MHTYIDTGGQTDRKTGAIPKSSIIVVITGKTILLEP
jgi:hypothetical protein